MPLSWSKTKANGPFTVARTPPFSTSRDHCTLLTDIKVSFAITDVSTGVQKLLYVEWGSKCKSVRDHLRRRLGRHKTRQICIVG